jgi:hypothetical protein
MKKTQRQNKIIVIITIIFIIIILNFRVVAEIIRIIKNSNLII